MAAPQFPRPPTAPEAIIIATHFPNVHLPDPNLQVTAPPDSDYNCFAMALWPPNQVENLASVGIALNELLQIYQARGYVQVNAGTEGAIDIWGGPDPTEFDVPPNQRTIVATHACRPSPIGPAGYYESKLGELFAFTHPRDALGSRMLARGPNILGYGERIASVRRPQ